MHFENQYEDDDNDFDNSDLYLDYGVDFGLESITGYCDFFK